MGRGTEEDDGQVAAAALRATAAEPDLHRGADELSLARAETEEVWGVLVGCQGPVGSADRGSGDSATAELRQLRHMGVRS